MTAISTRLILRLMDDEGRLLGWGFMETEARGDGALWPAEVCVGVGELTGTASRIIVHWPDLHLQVAAPIQSFDLTKEQPFAFAWQGPILRLDNPAEHPPLPPVTVRKPVVVAVPVLNLGLKGLA